PAPRLPERELGDRLPGLPRRLRLVDAPPCPLAREDGSRPLRPPGRTRPAGRGVAPPYPPPPGRTGRGPRLPRLRRLAARVRAVPRLLRGRAEEAVRRPLADRGLRRGLPRLPDEQGGVRPPRDPERHAGRGHRGRVQQGRVIPGRAGDQPPLG